MTFGRPPEIWLVTGIPGAGKTTVARALAERLDRSAVIEGDALRRWIVRGAEWPADGALQGEAERQYELAIRNMCLLARSYAEAGFTPFLDLVVVTRYHLEAFRGYLRGARLRLVVLAPAVEVTVERDRARGGQRATAGPTSTPRCGRNWPASVRGSTRPRCRWPRRRMPSSSARRRRYCRRSNRHGGGSSGDADLHWIPMPVSTTSVEDAVDFHVPAEGPLLPDQAVEAYRRALRRGDDGTTHSYKSSRAGSHPSRSSRASSMSISWGARRSIGCDLRSA